MAEILVCDDDREIVEAIEIYLTQEGHHILKAYDGEQAIRALQSNPVDLLIIDVMMPVMEGFELVENLKKVSANKDYIYEYAKKISKVKNAYFVGRGFDYKLALEASLKLKEVSYIHSEATYAGELKHGPIALIDKNFLTIFMITDKKFNDIIDSNIS